MKFEKIGTALLGYVYLWLGMFIMAMITALSANGLYDVPLWQVANVQLGGFLGLIFLLEALLGVGLVTALFTGEWKRALILPLTMIGYGFLCYASLLAFEIYGLLGGIEFKTESFVVQDMYGFLAAIIEPVYTFTLGEVSTEGVDRWVRIISIFLMLITSVPKVVTWLSQKRKTTAEAGDGLQLA